jgi:hypothetical protein
MNKVKIDWITLTTKKSTADSGPIRSPEKAMALAKEFWMDLGTQGGTLVLMQGKLRYPFVWHHVESGSVVHVSEEPWKQGLMFVASGRACDNVGQVYTWVKNATEHNFNCTRIDIAIDVHNSGVTVQDAYFAHRAEYPNERRKTTFTQGTTGDTFTIGSRASNKYLRVYDKAAQQDQVGDWLRVEMEYKGDAARAAFAAVRHGAHNLVADISAFLGLNRAPLMNAIYELNGGQGERITVAKKVMSDRERWMRKTVFPAWVSWAEEHPADAWQTLYDLLQRVSDIVKDPD